MYEGNSKSCNVPFMQSTLSHPTTHVHTHTHVLYVCNILYHTKHTHTVYIHTVPIMYTVPFIHSTLSHINDTHTPHMHVCYICTYTPYGHPPAIHTNTHSYAHPLPHSHTFHYSPHYSPTECASIDSFMRFLRLLKSDTAIFSPVCPLPKLLIRTPPLNIGEESSNKTGAPPHKTDQQCKSPLSPVLHTYACENYLLKYLTSQKLTRAPGNVLSVSGILR